MKNQLKKIASFQNRLHITIFYTFLLFGTSSCEWLFPDDDCEGENVVADIHVSYIDRSLLDEESTASVDLSYTEPDWNCVDLHYNSAIWNNEPVEPSGVTGLDSLEFTNGTLIIGTNVGDFETAIDLSPIYLPSDLTLSRSDDFRMIWEGEPLSYGETVLIEICHFDCVEQELSWTINNDGLSWFIIPNEEFRWLLPGEGTITLKRRKEYTEQEDGHFTMKKEIKTKFTSLGTIRINL